MPFPSALPFPIRPTCRSSLDLQCCPLLKCRGAAGELPCWGVSSKAEHLLVGCQAGAEVPPCWTLEAVGPRKSRGASALFPASHSHSFLCASPGLVSSAGQLVQELKLAEN